MDTKKNMYYQTAFLFSGKKGSGKDTTAPLVMGGLGLTEGEVQYMYFADPLKNTLDEIISVLRASETEAEARVNLLQVEDDMPEWVRGELIKLLFERVHQEPGEHARSHSAPVVAALQLYGTDFRRSQNEDYWVERAEQAALKAFEAGRVPCFMDARFPNEVTSMTAFPTVSIRLEVSLEEQLRRLSSRDGRPPNVEELQHRSETSLDDFTGFDVSVDTDLGLDETVKAVVRDVQVVLEG